MINAVFTGSRKYGTPLSHSDWDFAVHVTEETLKKMTEASSSKYKVMFDGLVLNPSWDAATASLDDAVLNCNLSYYDRQALSEHTISGRIHLANVNLIPFTDVEDFWSFQGGTEELYDLRPVSRERAIQEFKRRGVSRVCSGDAGAAVRDSLNGGDTLFSL